MDDKSSPGIPVTVELPPLVIPEGISPDELSKAFMGIILRKALSENNPLSKWILLGASEVLQGRVPKLTPTMLSKLVDTSQQSQVSGSVDTQEEKRFEDKEIQCELWRQIKKQ